MSWWLILKRTHITSFKDFLIPVAFPFRSVSSDSSERQATTRFKLTTPPDLPVAAVFDALSRLYKYWKKTRNEINPFEKEQIEMLEIAEAEGLAVIPAHWRSIIRWLSVQE